MYVQLTLNDEDGVPEVYSTPPWTDDADGRAETARVVVDPVGRPDGDRAGVLPVSYTHLTLPTILLV